MDKPGNPERDMPEDGSANDAEDFAPNWVEELIAMTRPGAEIQFPAREVNERPVPFVYDDFD